MTAYSPNSVEVQFSEVSVAPVQHLWAAEANIGYPRVLGVIPQGASSYSSDS